MLFFLASSRLEVILIGPAPSPRNLVAPSRGHATRAVSSVMDTVCGDEVGVSTDYSTCSFSKLKVGLLNTVGEAVYHACVLLL